ncbi:Phosphatidylinositol transfer domain containing protein [Plasmodium coatneyi]|uniref:Phosphatidylinositol transfer domain containing protein n=1 Tax=Plasmodium coatneyi TaxID=208452 RepID=A0A1B1E3W9_9APIC|nr:Phosphatidylinositol transfer domain containing protein [Plasmodium coatneyi]ANQ09695.1 Phosphatidylinositol transfer domain containing protein [Plasmodium coatneyi]
MKLIEFRLTMPLTMEEFNICQRYLLARVTQQDTNNTITGVGKNNRTDVRKLVLFKKGTLDDENGKAVDYTFKRMNLVSKIPKWLQNFVDPKYCLVDEKSWNSSPNLKVEYEAKGFPKASVKVDSTHHMGYNTEENAFNISDELLAQRKVILIDIVNDKVSCEDYNPEEDPTVFYSEKAKRGKLGENWIENSKVVVTCYKLFTIDIPYFGVLCSKLENWIVNAIKKNLLKYHRKALCWIDEWYNLTEERIDMFEEGLRERLENFWKEVGLDVEKDSNLAVQFMAEQQARGAFEKYVNNCDDGDMIKMDDPSIGSTKSGSSDGDTTNSYFPPTKKEHMKVPCIKGRTLSGVSTNLNTSDLGENSEEKADKKDKSVKKKKKKKKKKSGSEEEEGEKGSKGSKKSAKSEGKEKSKKKGEEVDVKRTEGCDPCGSQGNHEGGECSKLAEADTSTEAGDESTTTVSSTLNVDEEPYAQEEEPTVDVDDDGDKDDNNEEVIEEERPTKKKISKGSKSSKDDINKKKSKKPISSNGEGGLEEVENEAAKNITLGTPGDVKIRRRVLREVHKMDEDILLTEEEEEGVVVSPMGGVTNDGDTIVQKNLNGDVLHMGTEPTVDRAFVYKSGEHLDGEYTKYVHGINEGVSSRPWKLHYVFVTKNKMNSAEGGIMNPLSTEKYLKRIHEQRIGKFKGGDGLLMDNPFTKRMKMLNCENGMQMSKCRIDGANNGEGGNDHLFTPIDLKNFYPQDGASVECMFQNGHTVPYNDADAILRSFNVVNNAVEENQMVDHFAQNEENIYNYREDMRPKDSNTSLSLFYVIAMICFVYSSMSIYKRARSLFYFLFSAFICACAFVYYEYWNHSCFNQGNVYKFSMNAPGSINSVTSFLDVQRKQNPQEEFYRNLHNTLYEMNKTTLNFASNSLNAEFQSAILKNFNEIFSAKGVKKFAQYMDNS